MSWPMVRKAVRDLRWTTFWYAFGMALFIFLMTSFYPTLERQQEQFVELLRLYPEFLFRIFGIDPT